MSRRFYLLPLAVAALVAACGSDEAAKEPAAPPAMLAGSADPGPFPPETPASVEEIKHDPVLLRGWKDYCAEIREMAFIMIHPPPPGAARIMADQRKCQEIFPDRG